MRTFRILALPVAGLCCGAMAGAQSLFVQPTPMMVEGEEAPDPAQALYGVSLYAIQPPEPRLFHENDLITILVVETASMKRDQKTTADKDYSLDTVRIYPPDLFNYLILNGNPAQVNPLDPFSVNHGSEFEGDGKYERKDTVQTRVTARVLEVKPNGTLLLEARSTVQTDGEVQTFILSGLCRSEDVSPANTVQSSQIYNLTFEAHHEGMISDVNKKGVFTQALDLIFNF